jgi:hypothetical protein
VHPLVAAVVARMHGLLGPLEDDGDPRLAFGADPGLRPEAHILLGMNAHINYDLPQSLANVIPPEDFAAPSVLDGRRRDHERIDDVLAARIGAEDVALERAGGRRTAVDRLLAPVNRRASRLFLRESRRMVWVNTRALQAARMVGAGAYAVRLADLLRPGPVLMRLAVHGCGVTLANGLPAFGTESRAAHRSFRYRKL